MDNQTAFIEIRGATGGDEAKLWGDDLLRMYSRYATKKNWKLTQIDEKTVRIGGLGVFDALKNELENDKTYLGDDDAVRGYFFISFLSLYLYYKILNIIKEKKLTHKISVNEVLLELSRIYEISFDNKKKLGPIPERVSRLMENLGINIKHIP